MKLKNIGFFVLLFFTAVVAYAQVSIPANHKCIRNQGRMTLDANRSRMYWPGSSVKLYFKGQEVGAVLQDQKGQNYYTVLLDGKEHYRLRALPEKKEYVLFDNLKDTVHSIELIKRTEFTNGYTDFFGFLLNDSLPLLSAPEERKIAFYGNSISCGYAVEDYEGKDRPDSIYTNHCLAFPYLVAKTLEASYTCTCRSGIGVSVSWTGETMPDIYQRTNPNDPKSTWDFQQDYVDVVVVNLLQNDAWIIQQRKHPAYMEQFGKQKVKPKDILEIYKAFLLQLRAKYPESKIVCMLGNMDISAKSSPWPEEVQELVSGLNDDAFSCLIVPYKKTEGHPSVAEQKELADALTSHLQGVLGW